MTHGIILTLGGGGARGLAHLGVLQTLEHHEIPVAAVAGTSMGGLLGALYCANVPLEVIEKEVMALARPRDLLKFVDLGRSASGISLKGARIYQFLTQHFGGELQFDALKVPLAVVAVDLKSGRPVVLNSGSVAEAVRATISVPQVFEPVVREGMHLVDGGLLNNLPVDVARSLGEGPVLAVDVVPHFRANEVGSEPVVKAPEVPHLPGFLRIAALSSSIMIAELTAMRLEASPPALILRPDLPQDVAVLYGFQRAGAVIEAGRQAARQALPQLRDLLNR